MTPIKQTVYLPVEEGTSDMSVTYWEECTHVAEVKEVEGYFFTQEQLNEYTSNIIRKALDTAAEKGYGLYEDETAWRGFSRCRLKKESITNTFEETYKKFEV